jgi:hypothetical protein
MGCNPTADIPTSFWFMACCYPRAVKTMPATRVFRQVML